MEGMGSYSDDLDYIHRKVDNELDLMQEIVTALGTQM
jgi:hypothetical protein